MANNPIYNNSNYNTDVSQPFWQNLNQTVFNPAANLSQLPTANLAGIYVGAPLGIKLAELATNYFNRGKAKVDQNSKEETERKAREEQAIKTVADATQSAENQLNFWNNQGISTPTAFTPLGNVSQKTYDDWTGKNSLDNYRTLGLNFESNPQSGENLFDYNNRMNFYNNLGSTNRAKTFAFGDINNQFNQNMQKILQTPNNNPLNLNSDERNAYRQIENNFEQQAYQNAIRRGDAQPLQTKNFDFPVPNISLGWKPKRQSTPYQGFF